MFIALADFGRIYFCPSIMGLCLNIYLMNYLLLCSSWTKSKTRSAAPASWKNSKILASPTKTERNQINQQVSIKLNLTSRVKYLAIWQIMTWLWRACSSRRSKAWTSQWRRDRRSIRARSRRNQVIRTKCSTWRLMIRKKQTWDCLCVNKIQSKRIKGQALRAW